MNKMTAIWPKNKRNSTKSGQKLDQRIPEDRQRNLDLKMTKVTKCGRKDIKV